VAIGASPGQVRRMVLRRGMILTGAGLLIGVLGSSRPNAVLDRHRREVDPYDPMILAIVCLGLAGVAFLATFLPARRATRIDPRARPTQRGLNMTTTVAPRIVSPVRSGSAEASQPRRTGAKGAGLGTPGGCRPAGAPLVRHPAGGVRGGVAGGRSGGDAPAAAGFHGGCRGGRPLHPCGWRSPRPRRRRSSRAPRPPAERPMVGRPVFGGRRRRRRCVVCGASTIQSSCPPAAT
jgi:hypothetical protein